VHDRHARRACALSPDVLQLILTLVRKTEADQNRGFFFKTEPKPTDISQCETVTTLLITVSIDDGFFSSINMDNPQNRVF